MNSTRHGNKKIRQLINSQLSNIGELIQDLTPRQKVEFILQLMPYVYTQKSRVQIKSKPPQSADSGVSLDYDKLTEDEMSALRELFAKYGKLNF